MGVEPTVSGEARQPLKLVRLPISPRAVVSCVEPHALDTEDTAQIEQSGVHSQRQHPALRQRACRRSRRRVSLTAIVLRSFCSVFCSVHYL